MMKNIIDYFGGEKKFYIILAALFIMWCGIMCLFWLKTDEVTKDACSVCAKQVQDEVTCSVGSQGQIIQRIYYPNFTIIDSINNQFPR